jgi:hypothetical protein
MLVLTCLLGCGTVAAREALSFRKFKNLSKEQTLAQMKQDQKDGGKIPYYLTPNPDPRYPGRFCLYYMRKQKHHMEDVKCTHKGLRFRNLYFTHPEKLTAYFKQNFNKPIPPKQTKNRAPAQGNGTGRHAVKPEAGVYVPKKEMKNESDAWGATVESKPTPAQLGPQNQGGSFGTGGSWVQGGAWDRGGSGGSGGGWDSGGGTGEPRNAAPSRQPVQQSLPPGLSQGGPGMQRPGQGQPPGLNTGGMMPPGLSQGGGGPAVPSAGWGAPQQQQQQQGGGWAGRPGWGAGQQQPAPPGGWGNQNGPPPPQGQGGWVAGQQPPPPPPNSTGPPGLRPVKPENPSQW